MCCLSASEFHIPPARLSIAGNPKGKHAGALSFGYFSLSKQSKSNSPIKGEKHESIQEKQVKKKPLKPGRKINHRAIPPTSHLLTQPIRISSINQIGRQA
ncbi:MAG: hypothetical protein IEMM0001_1509 [bacterium]|nr:MAG: hypothetical protein IEMM0001_1509 [bacterium]